MIDDGEGLFRESTKETSPHIKYCKLQHFDDRLPICRMLEHAEQVTHTSTFVLTKCLVGNDSAEYRFGTL
jgi:hypothetical protein